MNLSAEALKHRLAAENTPEVPRSPEAHGRVGWPSFAARRAVIMQPECLGLPPNSLEEGKSVRCKDSLFPQQTIECMTVSPRHYNMVVKVEAERKQYLQRGRSQSGERVPDTTDIARRTWGRRHG